MPASLSTNTGGYRRCVIVLVLVFILPAVIVILQIPKTKTNSTAIAPRVHKLTPSLKPEKAKITLMNDQSRNVTSRPFSTQLTVIQPQSFNPYNEKFKCITTRVHNLKFPVCVYTATTDIYLTGMLLRGSYFEREEVVRFLRLLRNDRRLQFVDIGANIGLFSLPAAHVTRVVAVEPNGRSMARLSKAVSLSKIGSNITLVHHAVSDVRETLHMGVDPTNQGHAFLIRSAKCRSTPEGTRCNTLPQTSTILLNDLLPLMHSSAALLKVDVEGHEDAIFTESSAGQFFDKIDIPVVFMEWMWCKKHPAAKVQRLLSFFQKRNYTAFDLRNSKLRQHYRNWPVNILFKKSARPNYRF